MTDLPDVCIMGSTLTGIYPPMGAAGCVSGAGKIARTPLIVILSVIFFAPVAQRSRALP